METDRAKQIASAFLKVNDCQVEEVAGGLLVQYHGKTAYFVRESCFWPFVYRITGVSEDSIAQNFRA
jgi:hypothetical protein